MKEYMAIIESVSLFQGIDRAELRGMLSCLGSEIRPAEKDEIILLAGDKPEQIGVVLSGQVHIAREDDDGRRSLMGTVAPGGIFAEALCCAGLSESPVTVMADVDSIVMLLNFSRILRTCPNSCVFHARLIENMLGIIANKNLQLQNRMDIVGLKSVRAKVLRYLELSQPKQGREIIIPFSREEMADFLCVERTALSHELSRMKRDGLIDYRKNRFTLT